MYICVWGVCLCEDMPVWVHVIVWPEINIISCILSVAFYLIFGDRISLILQFMALARLEAPGTHSFLLPTSGSQAYISVPSVSWSAGYLKFPFLHSKTFLTEPPPQLLIIFFLRIFCQFWFNVSGSLAMIFTYKLR